MARSNGVEIFDVGPFMGSALSCELTKSFLKSYAPLTSGSEPDPKEDSDNETYEGYFQQLGPCDFTGSEFKDALFASVLSLHSYMFW